MRLKSLRKLREYLKDDNSYYPPNLLNLSKSPNHVLTKRHYPTHDTGRKKIYLQKGEEITTPLTTNTPSPMRVEKSKPTTKACPQHTLHTHPNNCTGIKNNTRVASVAINASMARAAHSEKK